MAGFWGMLAVGIFVNKNLLFEAFVELDSTEEWVKKIFFAIYSL
jgi:hypothetical protein